MAASNAARWALGLGVARAGVWVECGRFAARPLQSDAVPLASVPPACTGKGLVRSGASPVFRPSLQPVCFVFLFFRPLLQPVFRLCADAGSRKRRWGCSRWELTGDEGFPAAKARRPASAQQTPVHQTSRAGAAQHDMAGQPHGFRCSAVPHAGQAARGPGAERGTRGQCAAAAGAGRAGLGWGGGTEDPCCLYRCCCCCHAATAHRSLHL